VIGEEERGRLVGGSRWSWLNPRVKTEVEFKDGTVEFDGLPPIRGEIDLFLANGDQVSFPIELEVGLQTQRLEL